MSKKSRNGKKRGKFERKRGYVISNSQVIGTPEKDSRRSNERLRSSIIGKITDYENEIREKSLNFRKKNRDD